MTAIEILRAASRSVPNEDYVQFMAAVDAVESAVEALSYAVDNSNFNSAEFDRLARAAIAKAKGESDGR